MAKYNNLRELTPESMQCGIAACPRIYGNEGSYLIIGTKVNPENFGLAKKVAEDEVLISVPKHLIDKKLE